MIIDFFSRYQFGQFKMKPDNGDAGGSGGGAADAGAGAGDAGVGDAGGSGDNAGGDAAGGSGAGDGKAGAADAGGAGKAAAADAGGKAADGAAPKLDANGKPIVADGKAADADKGIWGEDWREAYAGEDTKKLAQLKRYESPKAAMDALFAAQEKIRTGAVKEPLGKDAKPEEVAAWRKANGIPETAEGYFEKLPEGVVMGDADKEGFKGFIESAHANNAPPEFVAMAVQEYQKRQEELNVALQAEDNNAKNECIALLSKEFGPEYTANINSMRGLVEAHFPKETHEALYGARLADGTALFNHPDMIRSLVRISREINPMGTPTPGGGFDKLDDIDSQIKVYEGRMKTDRNNWFKDEKAQNHYKELLRAKERFTKK